MSCSTKHLIFWRKRLEATCLWRSSDEGISRGAGSTPFVGKRVIRIFVWPVNCSSTWEFRLHEWQMPHVADNLKVSEVHQGSSGQSSQQQRLSLLLCPLSWSIIVPLMFCPGHSCILVAPCCWWCLGFGKPGWTVRVGSARACGCSHPGSSLRGYKWIYIIARVFKNSAMCIENFTQRCSHCGFSRGLSAYCDTHLRPLLKLFSSSSQAAVAELVDQKPAEGKIHPPSNYIREVPFKTTVKQLIYFYLNLQVVLLKHKSFLFPPHPMWVPHGFVLRGTKTVFPLSSWWDVKQKLDH